MRSEIKPRRGEIWRVQLDPIRGSEQGKTRPVVILSQPPFGRPSTRLGAPLTSNQTQHDLMLWCVAMRPDTHNGLTKDSTVDLSQTRVVDLDRFETQVGRVTPEQMDEIKFALITTIGGAPKVEE